MARNIITGIDIGTHTTRVVIAEQEKGKVIPRILGTGTADSKGLRRGYIVNPGEATKSIRQAIRAAEKKAGVRAKSGYVSVGGVSLESIISQGHAIISRADSQVTQLDIDNALTAAEEHINDLSNKKIIERVPLKWKLDGKEVWGHPEGMKGSKLEVKVLFITCLEHHLDEIIHVTEEAGVDVEEVVPAPLAASLVALSKRQRTVGVVLANIGAETVSIVVFEDDIPISLQVFPIGSTDITNDIALGFRIPLDEAEELKTGRESSTFPRKRLDDIIEARLSDIFDLIEAHLKKIGRNGLLPAGIIITGGGAGISTIEDLAKATLRLPSVVPSSRNTPPTRGFEDFQDSSWFVAYGLCILGANHERTPSPRNPLGNGFKKKLLSWLKQLVP